MQLEKLSHTKDELEKNLLTLRSENSNLKKREQAREEERKKIEESERLQNERLYDKFRSPAGWEPTDTDWHKLFISVDKLYPKMVTTLQKSTSLNESERKICYLREMYPFIEKDCMRSSPRRKEQRRILINIYLIYNNLCRI